MNNARRIPARRRTLGAIIVDMAKLLCKVDCHQGGEPTPEQVRKLKLLYLEHWLAELSAKADSKRQIFANRRLRRKGRLLK